MSFQNFFIFSSVFLISIPVLFHVFPIPHYMWHASMQATMAPVRKSFSTWVDGPLRRRCRLKRTWMKVIKMDLNKCNLHEDKLE